MGKRAGVAGRLWKPEEVARLREMVAAGRPYAEIGRELGRSKASCFTKGCALGLRSGNGLGGRSTWTPERRAKLKEMCEAGAKWREISAVLNLSEHALRDQAAKLGVAKVPYGRSAGPAWQPREDRYLLAQRKCGVAYRAIGEHLGRSEHSCAVRWERIQGYGDRKCYVKPKAPPPKRRKCLGPLCMGKHEFLSKGPENRMCSSCRQSALHLHTGHV